MGYARSLEHISVLRLRKFRRPLDWGGMQWTLKVIGGGTNEPLRPADLEFFLGLENAMRESRAVFEQQALHVLQRARSAGAEPGPHRVEVREHEIGNVRNVVLVVDGHERYRQLVGSSAALAQRA